MAPEESHSRKDLLLRIHDLTMRLEEAQDALSAIRTGRVDALIVKIEEDERIYTLKGADQVYHILFETLNEGALTLSPDSTILSANTRFARLVGLSLDQVLGLPLSRFVAPEDLPVFAQLLETGMQGRSKGEFTLHGADERRVPVMVSMNAIGVEGAYDCTAVITDLTDLREAQEGLRKAYAELEQRVEERTAELAQVNEALKAEIAERKRTEEALQEADQRKDEFLSMLSHELRNPLAAIASAVQILHMKGTEDPMVRYAQGAADRQVRHMTRLLDDLLDVSRITHGKIALRREPVDLGTIVGHALQVVTPFIQEQRHELSISLPPEPLRLEADPDRLAQVLCNLLDNAAKYTPRRGHIELIAGREDDEVVVRVRDDGVGIPPEVLPHIFDLFQQADLSLDRSQGGLGIGLTLVQRLVELHGGRVDAYSPGLGNGSEFVVRLPALPLAPEGQPPVIPSGKSDVRSRRILLVDDNEDAARMITVLLEMDGHAVRVAYDGPAALEAVREYRPDVILLDIGLPGMDGYEVARRLRQQEGLEKVLVIALTGYGQDQDREQSREAGFDHHLVKPIEFEELRRLLTPGSAES